MTPCKPCKAQGFTETPMPELDGVLRRKCKICCGTGDAEQGNWIPASNGSEIPFLTKAGRMLQYCYQASTGKHAYLDCGTDIILTDQEARQAMESF